MQAGFVAIALAAGAPFAHAQFHVRTGSDAWMPHQRTPRAGSGCYGYSDCDPEATIGFWGEVAWFQGFDTKDQGLAADGIASVTASYGDYCTSGGCTDWPSGAIYVYDDPHGDKTDPTDLRGADLVASADWDVCCPFGNVKELVDLPTAGVVTDGFWVAVVVGSSSADWPAPIDLSTGPSNGVSWLTGAWNFDPTNPGAGVGFNEMSTLGYDGHWVVSAEGGGPRPYCTAKPGLTCGAPRLGFEGSPGAGEPDGFTITSAPAPGGRSGLFLYSCDGRAAIPFDGGLLCVAPPVRRSVVVGSNGTPGQCDGAFALDWNAFASGQAGGQPDPCLGSAGQAVHVQCWGRDSATTGSYLSHGLELVM